MPRTARIVAIGYPHHITQRGNFCQPVFKDDKDKEQYLLWIQEYSDKYKLSILTHCLMPNHVHFIGIPEREDSLARTFNTAHMRYAQYVNKKEKRNGHLWQGRFFSCILDNPHLLMAARYIERNPVRAKLVKKPWEWVWSSAQAHINGEEALFSLSNLFDYVDMTPQEWKKYIDRAEERGYIDTIKQYTSVGRPLGTLEFVKKLEKELKERFPLLSRGRPRTENK
ncbi:transposase [Candidatus Omnitrophota bacterium]